MGKLLRPSNGEICMDNLAILSNNLGSVQSSGFNPSILGSISASLDSIPASWVQPQHPGFNPSIFWFNPSIRWTQSQHFWFIPAFFGLNPSILGLIPAFVGLNPIILGFNPSILWAPWSQSQHSLNSIPAFFDTMESEGRQMNLRGSK